MIISLGALICDNASEAQTMTRLDEPPQEAKKGSASRCCWPVEQKKPSDQDPLSGKSEKRSDTVNVRPAQARHEEETADTNAV